MMQMMFLFTSIMNMYDINSFFFLDLLHIIQSVHHVHHPDQLLLHGHVRTGVLGQVPGVSTPACLSVSV